ncbi:MAG: ribonuclease VapC [Archaeoglobales archaeon]|nr:ribonuclease VapC [Archaeoglobales archaeon]
MEADRSRYNRLKAAVIDTNVFIYASINGVDILEQLRDMGFVRILIPSSVLEELKKLAENLKGAEKRAAIFAIKTIDEKKLEVVDSKKSGDEALIEVAEKEKAVIITNDKELKKTAINKKIPIGTLREGSRVVIFDYL